MRKTNTTKSNYTAISATNKPDPSTQTPIEIALQIDENGMTTASNLYTFLELHPSNFSKWCKRNIENNSFATEGMDYLRLVVQYESASNIKPKTRIDYKITSDFAKKLSMTGNTEKHEQARQYFIACEQGLKIATKKLQDTALQQDQLTKEFVSTLKTINDTLLSMNDRISKLETQQSQQLQSSKPQQPAIQHKRYSYWTSKMFPKYQLLMEYFGITEYKELYKQLYHELQNTYPDIELNQVIDDYCYENHLDSCFTLDAIEHDKAVRKLFEGIVDNLLEKYNLTPDTKTVRYKTIFDN